MKKIDVKCDDERNKLKRRDLRRWRLRLNSEIELKKGKETTLERKIAQENN